MYFKNRYERSKMCLKGSHLRFIDHKSMGNIFLLDNLYVGKNDGGLLQRCGPVPGKFLGIVGQDPSDSKPSRLHVDIF